jgi:hypothetical protein
VIRESAQTNADTFVARQFHTATSYRAAPTPEQPDHVGMGAVGSTSLDDEVVEFFSPGAAGYSYMFVTVFGVRSPRRVT